MNRKIEICRHCSAMMTVPVARGEEQKWFCKDTTYFVTGGFWVDSNCGLEQWVKREVPPKCRCYAEYFIEECNK